MSEVHVLTVKEPYATALVCGLVTVLVHKLKLDGKTCLIHVASETDLSAKDSAAYFRKIGDSDLTAEVYASLNEENADVESLLTRINTAKDSEDKTLAALLVSLTEEQAKPAKGHIIGLVTFGDSEPVATRHKNYTDEFMLFPVEKWKAHKGNVNLLPWTDQVFWE